MASESGMLDPSQVATMVPGYPPMVPDFVGYRKIPRLMRRCVVTEKIDGTNAQVHVLEDGRVLAGSRNRYITPDDDNHGFAKWVRDHEDELRELGPGRHFGEWWGRGIQRGYGLPEKRFSLLDLHKWSDARPACCFVVPVLYDGSFSQTAFVSALTLLQEGGSQAALGFMKPEGIVIWHEASGTQFKRTLEKDEERKGQEVFRGVVATKG